MNTAWNSFVKQAMDIHPAFSNEQLIKTVLKSRGATTFKPEYTNKFIIDLKAMISGWQTFLQDAVEIDKEFSSDKTVAKILHSHGIAWYGEFETNKGLNLLKEWCETNKPWNYPCPVCGAATKRDNKFDWMYRHECNGLGWKCTIGGNNHFHAAAWAPLKKKLVYPDIADNICNSAATR